MRDTYQGILRGAIKDAGLSLSEIAAALKDHGFHIDKSYISKLQNGKAGPASDELNLALATVLKCNPDLLRESAFYEKMPPELREKRNRLQNLQLLYERYKHADGEFMVAESGLTHARRTLQDAKNEMQPSGTTASIHDESAVVDLIRVPVVGKIAAGLPILAEDNIVDWEVIPNPGRYQEGELFSLIVKGDSMTGARIYEGDKVVVRVQPAVEDGEIAVVNVDGENATLKRVKRVNGSYVLFADNPKYDPIVIKSNEARICGKVIQVIFDPHRKS